MRAFAIAALLLLLVQTSTLVAQTPVAVASVEAREIEQRLQLTGNIVSVQQVGVASEVSAKVAKVLVEVGDVVSAGQALAQLRDQPVRLQLTEKNAQLRQEQAAVTIARLEEQRLKKLLRNKSISAGSYDQAKAQLQQAEARAQARRAEIALLSDRLQQHQILAPFAGVVTARPIEIGGWVNSGDAVMQVSALQPLRLELAVPQQYFVSLQTYRNSLRAKVSSDFSAAVDAPVQRLVPVVDDGRSFQLWLTLPNDNLQWLPGMSAKATLRWSGGSDYPLVVASDALVRQPDGSTLLWKIADDNNAVMAIAVAVGPSLNGQTAVRAEDLAKGDQIVVRGNESLRQGQIVRPLAVR